MINCSLPLRFLGLRPTGRNLHNLSSQLNQGLSPCPRRLSTSRNNMATRRSARLSAAVDTQKSAEPAPPAASRKRKAATTVKDSTENEAEVAPSTPRRRRVPKPDADAAATPTPSAVNLMAEAAYINGTTNTPKPKAISRLADPNRTNALLLSPQTSRIVTSTAAEPIPTPFTPSKPTSLSATTSDSLLSTAIAHLIKVDPRMKPLVSAHHCHIFSPQGLAEKVDPFESLSSGIISQQVSGAAAKAIKKRFIALFHPDLPESGGGDLLASTTTTTTTTGAAAAAADADADADADAAPAAIVKRFPTPSQVCEKSIEELRAAGLSQRKAEYLKGLAEKFMSGELSAQMLADAPYEEVLEKLIQVRGLGKWSVEMFACFGLKRMDVFSLGDLGVQRGMAAFVGRDVSKLKNKGGKWKYMSEKEMEEISERFRPYRSLFMWYMWRVEETDISTME